MNNAPVIHNRRARHDYHVLDAYELGVVLKGTEIKAVRQGKLILTEAFVLVRGGELFLANAYIEEYAQGNIYNHTPRRERKLLAHKPEIVKMQNATALKGHTLIPLKAYFKAGNLKIEVGVCKGKDAKDKRQDKAKQDAKLEIARALKTAHRI